MSRGGGLDSVFEGSEDGRSFGGRIITVNGNAALFIYRFRSVPIHSNAIFGLTAYLSPLAKTLIAQKPQ